MFQISLELAALICITIILSRMVSRWTPLFGFHAEYQEDIRRVSVLRFTVYLFCIAILRWDRVIESDVETKTKKNAPLFNPENDA